MILFKAILKALGLICSFFLVVKLCSLIPERIGTMILVGGFFLWLFWGIVLMFYEPMKKKKQ